MILFSIPLKLLSKCIMKARRDARNEKDFYKKMMGQAQKIDNLKPSQLNESVQDVPKVIWLHRPELLN